jgi:hypothetical protein
MNGKTAKLLRKYASIAKQSIKDLKKQWKNLPYPQRHKYRKIYNDIILRHNYGKKYNDIILSHKV